MELANLQVVSMKMDMLSKQEEASAKAEEVQKLKAYKSTVGKMGNW